MAAIRIARARKRVTRGVAIVEAAVVFGLLVFLTFALIEYGWMFAKMQQVTNAARQGARVAVLARSTNSDVLDSISYAMDTAGMGGSGYSVTLVPADITTPPPGEALTVGVAVPYANIALMGIPLIPVPSNLKTSVSMAKEGP